MNEATNVLVFSDGYCSYKGRKERGFAAWGYAVISDFKVAEAKGGTLGWGMTSGVAEFTGAMNAMRAAERLFPGEAKVLHSDSQELIYHLNEGQEPREPAMLACWKDIMERVLPGGRWRLRWIPRRENRLADLLATQAAHDEIRLGATPKEEEVRVARRAELERRVSAQFLARLWNDRPCVMCRTPLADCRELRPILTVEPRCCTGCDH